MNETENKKINNICHDLYVGVFGYGIDKDSACAGASFFEL